MNSIRKIEQLFYCKKSMQIEITPRWDYDRSGYVRYVFEKRYIDFLHSLQIDVETIVPVVCEKPRTLDGLMLTGGNDLAIFNSDSLCRRRDVYELAKIEQYQGLVNQFLVYVEVPSYYRIILV